VYLFFNVDSYSVLKSLKYLFLSIFILISFLVNNLICKYGLKSLAILSVKLPVYSIKIISVFL
jgi:hypothetical protein